jgi:hypothetical protein
MSVQKRAKEIIQSRGGIFSKTYMKGRLDGNGTIRYVIYTCNNGHHNDKQIGAITKIKPDWCQECKKNTKENVTKVGRSRGFEFLSEKYMGAHTKYDWRCINGHVFSASYDNINRGRGCMKCRMVPYEKIVKVAKSRGGLCLTPEEDFISASATKIKWKCAVGHIWETFYSSIVSSNTWCKQCRCSIGEKMCRTILEYIYKKPFEKIRPKWLERMELDGYNEELGIAFEYNGEQHYTRVNCWHKSEKEFLAQQERDIKKKRICDERGILLLVIPYTIKHMDIYDAIFGQIPPEKIPEHGIPYEIDYALLDL